MTDIGRQLAGVLRTLGMMKCHGQKPAIRSRSGG